MQTNADTILGLIEQAWAFRNGDYSAGLALAEQAVQASDCRGSRGEQGHALAVQGYFLLRLWRNPEARRDLSQALAISREAGDQPTEAHCLFFLGSVCCAVEEYAEALEFFSRSQTLYESLGDQRGLAEALNGVGTAYCQTDDLSQALLFYLQSLRLREALEDQTGVACSLNNIGIIYNELEDFERSVVCFERCLAVSREDGLERLQAICLCNLAQTYKGLNRPSEGVAAGKAALALSRTQGASLLDCDILRNIGLACAAEQDHAAAIGWLLEGIDAAQQSGSLRFECEIKNALGDSLLSAGQIVEAHAAFTRAAEIAEASELPLFRAAALAGLSRACEQQGKMAAALSHHKQLYALEKFLDREAAEKRTQTLLMQMEVENLQKDAQLHQVKNVELAALNAALEDANQALQAQAQALQAQAQALQSQAELLEAQGKELRTQADELQRQATEDGLTGLANRRHLESRLAARFADSRRTGSPLSIAMADVDHFKSINDRFGHQVGDEVLMSVGLLLRHACRETDLAARYGGEEFVLVLSGTETRPAHAACDRVRQAIENYAWHSIHPELAVTVSIGVSDDPDAPSYERLLGLADARLYEAKHSGRNRVVSASVNAPLNAPISVAVSVSAGRQGGGQKRQRQRPGLSSSSGIVRSAGVAEESMIRL